MSHTMDRLRAAAEIARREIGIYQALLRDSRTPAFPKIVLGAAVSYFLLPFDIVPDFIPVLGQLDDLLIVPGLIFLALRLIPAELVEEYRARVSQITLPPVAD